MADAPTRLTGKREAFVLAYLGEARFNATRAAKMAGYAESSAYQRGFELVNDSDVIARIQEYLNALAVPSGAVLSELADVGMAEWRDFIAIRRDPKTGEEVEVKMDLGAKVKALETLAKAHGLLTDKIDLTGQMTQTIELVGVAPEDV